jgi:hypothetical protein
MLVPPYDKPLKSWLAKYIRGKFLGDATDLAAPDQEYPIFHWGSKLKSPTRTETGGYEITPEETITAHFSDQVRFEQSSFEVWGPEGAAPPPETPEHPGELPSISEPEKTE